MAFTIILTVGFMAISNAAIIKPTTFSTATSPLVPACAVTPLANLNFATEFFSLSEKQRKKKPNPAHENINDKMAHALDLALIAMSEEHHIIEDDLEHYNPWDHLKQIHTGGFEHEGGMTRDQRRFCREFGIQLELLRRTREDANPLPPCTTIVVEIEGEKTAETRCPQRTAGW